MLCLPDELLIYIFYEADLLTRRSLSIVCQRTHRVWKVTGLSLHPLTIQLGIGQALGRTSVEGADDAGALVALYGAKLSTCSALSLRADFWFPFTDATFNFFASSDLFDEGTPFHKWAISRGEGNTVFQHLMNATCCLDYLKVEAPLLSPTFLADRLRIAGLGAAFSIPLFERLRSVTHVHFVGTRIAPIFFAHPNSFASLQELRFVPTESAGDTNAYNRGEVQDIAAALMDTPLVTLVLRIEGDLPNDQLDIVRVCTAYLTRLRHLAFNTEAVTKRQVLWSRASQSAAYEAFSYHVHSTRLEVLALTLCSQDSMGQKLEIPMKRKAIGIRKLRTKRGRVYNTDLVQGSVLLHRGLPGLRAVGWLVDQRDYDESHQVWCTREEGEGNAGWAYVGAGDYWPASDMDQVFS